jgi:hypothetical protein
MPPDALHPAAQSATLTSRWQGLGRRFDTRVLVPPVWPADADADADAVPGSPEAQRTLCAVQAWCSAALSGPPAGMARRLRVAQLGGTDAAGVQRLAQQLACTLDGSLRLAKLSRAAGLAWRLQVKWADAAWWRPRQAQDPCDAGWARSDPAALVHWAQGFVPRRPTLVLVQGSQAGSGLHEPQADDLRLPQALDLQPPLASALAACGARAGAWAHPVCCLWLGAMPGPALEAEARFSLSGSPP